MDWLKKKYEVAALFAGALLAILAAGWFLLQSVTFSDQLKKRVAVTGKESDAKILPIAPEVTSAVEDLMKKTIKWEPTKLEGSAAANLFVGSPVVKKAGGDPGGVRILDPKAAPLRPPVPNEWLYNNGIDLTRTDCLELDSDKDTYTNLEEFEADTDPRNPESRPLPHKKLQYVECIKNKYEIKWGKMSSTEYQVQRMAGGPDGKAENKIGAVVGDVVFKDQRFKILQVEEKDGKSFMSFEDLKNPVGSPFEVEEKTVFDRFTLSAKLTNIADGKSADHKEGDTMTLDGNVIKILKISETTIEIEITQPNKSVVKDKIALKK